MVYLLATKFYADIRPEHVIMALLSPLHGDISHLSRYPDLLKHWVPEEDDLWCMPRVMDKLNTHHYRISTVIAHEFHKFKQIKESETYVQAQKDSLRVIFAMYAIYRPIKDINGTMWDVMSERGSGFPNVLCKSWILRDEGLWIEALKEEKWLLNFLVAFADPPVEVLDKLEEVGIIDEESREAAEDAENMPMEWKEEEGDGYSDDGLDYSFKEMGRKVKKEDDASRDSIYHGESSTSGGSKLGSYT